MSFSVCPGRLQLLFSLTLLLAAAVPAGAQHRIVMRDGSVRQGEIVGASATAVQLKVEQGTIGVPSAQVARVDMPAPPAFVSGMAAYEKGDLGVALGSIRPLVETFQGLPTDWAQQATGVLGDIYLATNDLDNAEKAFAAFQQFYPGTGGNRAEVGMARLDFSRKDLDGARARLEPIMAEALETMSVSRIEGITYGQAFLLSGEIHEAQGNAEAALQDYLRTVTLFHHDATSVAQAQARADALRSQKTVRVP